MGPEDLKKFLGEIDPFTDPNLLYGAGFGDDTGVYKITRELAIVQTIDFFTPIVDDPYKYGRIAATNALSDIYTMGARPLTALSLLAIPCSLGVEVIGQILKGGADAVREAGAVIVGGHSVEDDEPKYGMAVTGIVDPQKMITNMGAKSGDALILTKKIGIGILSNVLKREGSALSILSLHGHKIDPAVFAEAEQAMMRLNNKASEAMLEFGGRASTDITGFGLLGHARNIADASSVRLVIEYSKVPKYSGVEDCAISGTEGGGERNYQSVKEIIEAADSITHNQIMVLCDAQTSGGLFIAVPPDKADAMLKRLHEGGDVISSIIGWVEEGPAGTIAIRP